MFFSAWAEIDVDARTCRVYVPRLVDGSLSVELDKGYLTIQGTDKQYTFRLGADTEQLEVVSARSLETLTMVTLQFGRVEVLTVSERWPEKPSEFPICCRSCGEVAVPAGRKAFLIPSMLWGFEEMRACEECAPMSHGNCKIRRTNHGERVYVGDRSFFVSAADGVRAECGGCRKFLGREVVPLTPFLSDLKVEGAWVEIRKFAVISDQLPFLSAYTALAELGCTVEKIFVELGERNIRLRSTEGGLEVSVRVLGAAVEVRPSEGERMPEEPSTRTVRCLRVLVNFQTSDADFSEQISDVDHDQLLHLVDILEKFPASADLWPRSGDWQLLYLPLLPEVDD